MAITTDDFNKIWASTSPLTPYEFSESKYKEGWNFVGATPPSRQMWDFLQKQNDEKSQYLLNNFDNYLPLSGGTMTGTIKVSGYLASNTNSTSNVRIAGGTNSSNGALLDLYGKDNSTYAGRFTIVANDGTNSKYFIGKPDGTLTWDGNNVITSAGGTMTGRIEYKGTNNEPFWSGSYGDGASFGWDYNSATGAGIGLYNVSRSADAGAFNVWAKDGSNSASLVGKPDGTLTWSEKNILTNGVVNGRGVQSGNLSNIIVNSNSYVQGTVTFSTPFGGTPHVVACNGSGHVNVNVSVGGSITTTGFAYVVNNENSSQRTTSIEWIAIY